MPHTYPNYALDGSFYHLLPNGNGLLGGIGIDAGPAAKIKVKSAGHGIQLVAADGVTVILDVPETGYVPPSVGGAFLQLTPQASAPAGITPGAIWVDLNGGYHGLDSTGDVSL